MSFEDLFKAVTIASANDATVALAEYTYGSLDTFINEMNSRAKLFGMNNTNFINVLINAGEQMFFSLSIAMGCMVTYGAYMTGRENIHLKGYILGLDDSQIKELEESIVDFAELGPYIDQPVRTYSSGMKMRLGFAINVNIKPDILVVDEALSVGDATFKIKCKNKIREIIDRNVTVLYVSHNPNSVKEICTRAIYMKRGRLIFDGPTEETHLIYTLDKRRTLFRSYKKQARDLEKIINGVTDKATVIPEQEKLAAMTKSMETLKAEIQKIKGDLQAFRHKYYGDNYHEVMRERRRAAAKLKKQKERRKKRRAKRLAEKDKKSK